MNYNSMTARELIHYLDLYNNDPVVRRLISLFSQEDFVAELVEVGMDPETQTFGTGWEKQSPGQYIADLRRHVDDLESDLEHTKYQLEEAETERDELQTRSIMDFVQEVWQEKRTATFKVQEALKEAENQRKENDRLREQIDMWGRMNQREKEKS